MLTDRLKILSPAEEEGNISSFKDYSPGAPASDAKESNQEESKASTGVSQVEEDRKEEDRPGGLSRSRPCQ